MTCCSAREMVESRRRLCGDRAQGRRLGHGRLAGVGELVVGAKELLLCAEGGQYDGGAVREWDGGTGDHEHVLAGRLRVGEAAVEAEGRVVGEDLLDPLGLAGRLEAIGEDAGAETTEDRLGD